MSVSNTGICAYIELFHFLSQCSLFIPRVYFRTQEVLFYFLLIYHHLGRQDIKLCRTVGQVKLNFPFSITSNGVTEHISRSRFSLSGDWSFIGGSRIAVKPKATRSVRHPKRSQIHASCNPFSCNLELVQCVSYRYFTIQDSLLKQLIDYMKKVQLYFTFCY